MTSKTEKRLAWAALVALLALMAVLSNVARAADTKISALPAGTTLGGTEPIPAVQSAATVRTTPAALSTYVVGQLTSANVISKWTGTCNASSFLDGSGACSTPAGGVSQSTGTGNLSYVNACTTTPTQGYAYVLTGQTVTLTFTTEFACTSDSTAMVSDALPLAIRPARAQVFLTNAQNNSGVVQACFAIGTDGVLTWYQVATGQCATSGAWTASGTKGPLTLIGSSPFIALSSAYTYTLN